MRTTVGSNRTNRAWRRVTTEYNQEVKQNQVGIEQSLLARQGWFCESIDDSGEWTWRDGGGLSIAAATMPPTAAGRDLSLEGVDDWSQLCRLLCKDLLTAGDLDDFPVCDWAGEMFSFLDCDDAVAGEGVWRRWGSRDKPSGVSIAWVAGRLHCAVAAGLSSTSVLELPAGVRTKKTLGHNQLSDACVVSKHSYRKYSNRTCLATFENVRASPIRFGEERPPPNIEEARRLLSFDRITITHLSVMKSWPKHCQKRNSARVLHHWTGAQHSIDEFHMVLGGQPTAFFFTTEFAKKHFLSYPSSTITRSCEARPMGKKGNQVSFVWCAIFEAVGADVFLNSGYPWQWVETK